MRCTFPIVARGRRCRTSWGGASPSCSIPSARRSKQIKAGKLYAVAIMADKRSQARPDVPTIGRSGPS